MRVARVRPVRSVSTLPPSRAELPNFRRMEARLRPVRILTGATSACAANVPEQRSGGKNSTAPTQSSGRPLAASRDRGQQRRDAGAAPPSRTRTAWRASRRQHHVVEQQPAVRTPFSCRYASALATRSRCRAARSPSSARASRCLRPRSLRARARRHLGNSDSSANSPPVRSATAANRCAGWGGAACAAATPRDDASSSVASAPRAQCAGGRRAYHCSFLPFAAPWPPPRLLLSPPNGRPCSQGLSPTPSSGTTSES